MRRNISRLRQEFLEKRQNERVAEAIHARKTQMRDALDSGAPIPGHLKKDALKLKKFVELDDDETKQRLDAAVDDEYAMAGVEDPKILVTTARNPSQKLVEFAKEVRLVVPNAHRMNRGSYNVKQIMDVVRQGHFSDVIVVSETQGIPDTLTVCHLPLGPTAVFTLHNVVTRHDLKDVGPMSEQYPHLIFENFTTKLGLRIASILKYLFPVPKPDARRVVTFDNANDFISFRNHTYQQRGKTVLLDEVGPRFEMTPYRILLGTLDMVDAETEYVMRPYINTAKKHTLL